MAIKDCGSRFAITADGCIRADMIKTGLFNIMPTEDVDIAEEDPSAGDEDFDTSDFVKYVTNINAPEEPCHAQIDLGNTLCRV